MKRFIPLFLLVFLNLQCVHRDNSQVKKVEPLTNFQLIDASPENGFHFPYILRLPPGFNPAIARFLLVEPNNTGTVSDDIDFHLEAAKKLSEKAVGAFVSKTLALPLLVPVFPRPETGWEIYTHIFDRDTILIKEGPMKRLDLQLLAMVEDASYRLKVAGMKVERKVLLTGFSASGSFVNRFTTLHPDRVHAVASGGLNGLLILPLKELSGTPLPYPLGLADFKQITGASFSMATWRRVPQFVYMGALDKNDAVQYDDGYSESEKNLVFKLIGEKMQPDRWKFCLQIYEEAEANVTSRTYRGIGHGTNREINTEIAKFFGAAILE